MKATITYNSLNAQVPWPAVLARHLEHWRTMTTITAAEVILEQQRNAQHAFRVKVRLEGPGQGWHAEARESTLEVALLTTTQKLEQQIQALKSKLLRPGKSKRSLSPLRSQGAQT